jgi:hypothetical protein
VISQLLRPKCDEETVSICDPVGSFCGEFGDGCLVVAHDGKDCKHGLVGSDIHAEFCKLRFRLQLQGP